MYYNNGGSLWYPERVQVLYSLTFLCKSVSSDHISHHAQPALTEMTHHRSPCPCCILRDTAHLPHQGEQGWGRRELQEPSSTRVGIHRTPVLGHFSNIRFLSGYSSLTSYANMLVINPARKNSGSSEKLLPYYMRGRFTGRAIGRSTALAGSPVEDVFHPRD